MIDVHETLSIITKLFTALIAIIGMLRWMGRKELKQKTPLQYCLLVILGGVVSIIATGAQYSNLEQLVIIVAWFLMIFILDWLKAHITTFRHLLEGKPQVIINEGEIIHEVLEEERMSEEELRRELRELGIFDYHEVKIAVIENDGRITATKNERVNITTEKDLQNQKV